MPVGDPKSQPWTALDEHLEVVLLRVPGYPLNHGAVGAIRSLGRAGVKVHAVVEDRLTPAALSRYLASKIVWPVEHGAVDEAEPTHLVERLVALGPGFAAPPLIVCTDDAAAVLAAENASVLAEHFLLPAVPADLPRRLANKYELARLCEEHDVPSPVTRHADTRDGLEAAIVEMTFPVVMKSTGLGDASVRQVIRRSSIVASEAELREAACKWEEPFGVVLQDYLPDDVSEDWFVHGYCDADARVRIAFTGRKLRSWPPRTGATACAYVHTNHKLVETTAALGARIGYRGIFDLDWRLDRRTGRYDLLDFNPRLGAQFRAFENDAGIDVVRAMHLDMAGRQIPAGSVTDGQRFVVEPFQLASRLVDRVPLATPAGYGAGRTRLAWVATDDPLPVLAMALRQGLQSLRCRLPLRAARDADAAPVPAPAVPDPSAASTTRGASAPSAAQSNGHGANGAEPKKRPTPSKKSPAPPSKAANAGDGAPGSGVAVNAGDQEARPVPAATRR